MALEDFLKKYGAKGAPGSRSRFLDEEQRQYDEPVDRGFIGNILHGTGETLGAAANVVSRSAFLPLAESLGQDDPLYLEKLRKLKEQKDNIYVGDILNQGGLLAHQEGDNPVVGFAKGTGRFLADVVTDPLTYVGVGGATKLGKVAAKLGAAKAEGISVKLGSKVAKEAAALKGAEEATPHLIRKFPRSLEGRPLPEQIAGGQRSLLNLEIPFTNISTPLVGGKVGAELAKPFSALSRVGLTTRLAERMKEVYPVAYAEGKEPTRVMLEQFAEHVAGNKVLTKAKLNKIKPQLEKALGEKFPLIEKSVKEAFHKETSAAPVRAIRTALEPFVNTFKRAFSGTTGNKGFDKAYNKFKNLVMYRSGQKIAEGLDFNKELDGLANTLSELSKKPVSREQVNHLVSQAIERMKPEAGPVSEEVLKLPGETKRGIKKRIQHETPITEADIEAGLNPDDELLKRMESMGFETVSKEDIMNEALANPEIFDIVGDEIRLKPEIESQIPPEMMAGAPEDLADYLVKNFSKGKEANLTPDEVLNLADGYLEDIQKDPAFVAEGDPLKQEIISMFREYFNDTMQDPSQPFKSMEDVISSLKGGREEFIDVLKDLIGKMDSDDIRIAKKYYDEIVAGMEKNAFPPKPASDIINELLGQVQGDAKEVDDFLRQFYRQDFSPEAGAVPPTGPQPADEAFQQAINDAQQGGRQELGIQIPFDSENIPEDVITPEQLENLYNAFGVDNNNDLYKALTKGKPPKSITYEGLETIVSGAGDSSFERDRRQFLEAYKPPTEVKPQKPLLTTPFGQTLNPETATTWEQIKPNAQGLGKDLSLELEKVFPNSFPPGWVDAVPPPKGARVYDQFAARRDLAKLGSHITGGQKLTPKVLDKVLRNLIKFNDEPAETLILKLEHSYANIDKVYITAADRGLMEDSVQQVAKTINEKQARQLEIEQTSGVQIKPLMADREYIAHISTPELRESWKQHALETGTLPRVSSAKEMSTKMANAMRRDFAKVKQETIDKWVEAKVIDKATAKKLKGKDGLEVLDEMLDEQRITENMYADAVHSLGYDEVNALIAAGKWKGNGNRAVAEAFHSDPVYSTTIRGVRGERARTSVEFYNDLKMKGLALPEGEAPTTWLPVKQAELAGFRLPPEVAKNMDGWYKFVQDPHTQNEFLHLFDKTQDWWKAWTLAVFPSYHIRNFVGNMWNNWLAGVHDLNDYKLALEVQFPGKFGQKTITGGLGKQYTSDSIMQVMKELGVVDRGFVAQDVGRTIEQELEKGTIWSPGRNNILVKKGFKFGSQIENNARIAHFINRIKTGNTEAEAALSVKKYLFDYSELTDFERNVMKRAFPFYAWTRKNVPLQIQHLIMEPAKFSSTFKAQNEFQNSTPASERYLPSWMSENFPLRIRKNQAGQYEYFLLNNWLPAADLAKVLQLHQTALNMMSPIPKEILQQAFNYDVFLKKKIATIPGQKTRFLGVDLPTQAVHAAKVVRLLNEVDKMTQEDVELANKITGILSGKTYLYDEQKGFNTNKYRVDDTIKELRQKLRQETVKNRPNEREIERITALINEAAKEY